MRSSYHVAVAGHENELRLREILAQMERPSLTDIIMRGDGIKHGVIADLIVALSDDEATLISLSCEIEYIMKIDK